MSSSTEGLPGFKAVTAAKPEANSTTNKKYILAGLVYDPETGELKVLSNKVVPRLIDLQEALNYGHQVGQAADYVDRRSLVNSKSFKVTRIDTTHPGYKPGLTVGEVIISVPALVNKTGGSAASFYQKASKCRKNGLRDVTWFGYTFEYL